MSRIAALRNIVENMEQVIVGKRREIELTLVTLLCRGHLLIEDVPGVGKTSLASALARSLDCSFKRIQFTPDIMPSDVTGFNMLDPKSGEFIYRPGAVMTNVILADEINRASPKTQSSLLEAMEERQVTVDGVTRKLEEPFIVLATQNPLEYLGTYPLPEAQMDRFFMRISLGYPTREEEMRMVVRMGGGNPLDALTPVVTAEEILKLQQVLPKVHVDPKLTEYIVSIVTRTREHPMADLRASPRASIALYKAAQAWALYNGRHYVLPDDVVAMSRHVLTHRIVPGQEARANEVSAGKIVRDAVAGVPVPAIQPA